MEPFKLDMKTMLPTIREAFNNKTLQMFDKDNFKPTYSGPCAIGVCLPEEIRKELDEDNDVLVTLLHARGFIIVEREGEIKHWSSLQIYHDDAVMCKNKEVYHDDNVREFGEILTSLEEVYA